MPENTATFDRSTDLRALYGPGIVPSVTGCRTCGIMGWENALKGR